MVRWLGTDNSNSFRRHMVTAIATRSPWTLYCYLLGKKSPMVERDGVCEPRFRWRRGTEGDTSD